MLTDHLQQNAYWPPTTLIVPSTIKLGLWPLEASSDFKKLKYKYIQLKLRNNTLSVIGAIVNIKKKNSLHLFQPLLTIHFAKSFPGISQFILHSSPVRLVNILDNPVPLRSYHSTLLCPMGFNEAPTTTLAPHSRPGQLAYSTQLSRTVDWGWVYKTAKSDKSQFWEFCWHCWDIKTLWWYKFVLAMSYHIELMSLRIKPT